MIHRLGEIPQAAKVGGKAASLDQLIRRSLPVPQGFVLDSDTWRDTAWKDQLGHIHKQIAAKCYAVRSSASQEDTEDQSMAGMFLSKTRVSPADLLEAVTEVLQSTQDPNAFSVIIQEWVEGDCSGISFSRHPTKFFKDTVIIDAAKGSAEGIVSGTTKTERGYIWLEHSLLPEVFPLQFELAQELGALVRRIEKDMACPVDIEWTSSKGHIVILQARPITRLPEPNLLDEEEGRLLFEFAQEKQLHLEHSSVAESLPFPSRSSFDLQLYLYRPEGSFAIAAKELKLAYDQQAAKRYFVTLFGRLYVRDLESPIQSSKGFFSTIGSIGTWQKALRDFPERLYKSPPLVGDSVSNISDLLRQVDVIGLNDARATLLSRLAVSMKHISGLDLPRIWKARQAWLEQRSDEVSTADFELSKPPKTIPRRKLLEPKNLIELYAILREDAKDELRPVLAALHDQLKTKGFDAALFEMPEEPHTALAWSELRLIGPDIELPQTIVWSDLFDLRNAYQKERMDHEPHGVGVSPGLVEGAETFVSDVPSHIPAGRVLVTQALTPDWFNFLETSHIAGIITETGSIMSHSAIQCRERALPAIFGVPGARSLFPTGTRVSFDGKSGEMKI